MEQKIDLSKLTDIQLMVIIEEVSKEYTKIDSDLKILNAEYARRCKEFREKNTATVPEEVTESVTVEESKD